LFPRQRHWYYRFGKRSSFILVLGLWNSDNLENILIETLVHNLSFSFRSILEGCPRLKKLSLQSCRGLPRGMKKDFEGETLEKLRVDIDTFDGTEDMDDENIHYVYTSRR
jgi:hypothetical protein